MKITTRLKYTIICTLIIWFIATLIAETTKEYICFIAGILCTTAIVSLACKILKKEKGNRQ